MREQVSQGKKATTSVSIPTLKQPTRGFGLESSNIAPQATPEVETVETVNEPLTHDISKISLLPQAKLSISQPGDFYEQQADSIAQQVMRRMAQPVNRHSIQRQEISEEKEDTEKEDTNLQMKLLVNFVTPLVQRQQMPEEEELQMKSVYNSHLSWLQRQQMPEEEEAQEEEPFSPKSKSEAQQYETQDNGHSLDRHGPEVSDNDLINRLTTGVAPDGIISPTPASTRFNNYKDWLQTRKDAMNYIATKHNIDLTKPPPTENEGPFTMTMDHKRAIGDGFVGDNSTSSKKQITDPSTGKKKKITVFSSSQKVSNLTRTTTSIQWNKGSNKWDVKQHYPDAKNWDQTKQIYTNMI